MKKNINIDLDKYGIVLIIIGILSRLVPHIPNVNPLISISLIAGRNFSSFIAFSVLFFTMFISDIGLALLFGYPIFSYWTLFTYTGFIAITFISSKLKYSSKALPIYIFFSSFAFWIWTNFGVWLTSDMYYKTLIGLINCYIAALPFLGNSLLGDMIWGILILSILNSIKAKFYNKKFFKIKDVVY